MNDPLKRDYGIIKTDRSPYCKLQSVDLQSVRWTKGFWADRFWQCCKITLPYQWKLLSDPHRGHALTNLKIAAGLEKGEYVGTLWQDEWVYKWLEAASYIYGVTGDPKLDQRMDEVIEMIRKAQHRDGYIATQILRVKKRFVKNTNHEIYVMGHLITASCAHHRSTGKRNFLDIGIKTADFLYRTFITRNPKLAHYCINPSNIMALVELYRTTDDKKYLKIANRFIDMRGSQPGGTDFNQTKVPFRKETMAVGHGVFLTYLCAGAADAYLEMGDQSLLKANERIWKDLTEKKMYVTGGIAALHKGFACRHGNWSDNEVSEAVGNEYQLHHSTAYNETCSQIGNMMWNWRMLAINGESRHADIMELSLYNSILSGIGIHGKGWFYTNVLRWHGKEQRLLTQDAYQRFDPGKNNVCCPSNLIRTTASIHGYLYSVSENGIWVHHYGGNIFDGLLRDGTRLKMTQETNYPWDGQIKIQLNKVESKKAFTIAFRIPHWADDSKIMVNGKKVNIPVKAGSYTAIRRNWRNNDKIELDLPMKPRLITAHPRVEETRHQAAIMRGPLVYCLESIDLPKNVRVDEIYLPQNIKFTARYKPALLNGVTVLEGEACLIKDNDSRDQLYRVLRPTKPRKQKIQLIPYFAWANRGISHMSVWFPTI